MVLTLYLWFQKKKTCCFAVEEQMIIYVIQVDIKTFFIECNQPCTKKEMNIWHWRVSIELKTVIALVEIMPTIYRQIKEIRDMVQK